MIVEVIVMVRMTVVKTVIVVVSKMVLQAIVVVDGGSSVEPTLVDVYVDARNMSNGYDD